MEENHLGGGRHFLLSWVCSKRRVFHITLLVSICIWVFLQMANSYNNGSANADETSLQGSSKVISRKLLSQQLAFEDETNEPWDIVAGEDERFMTIKENGGVGDDEFDDEEVEENGEVEEHNEDDVERMVNLDNQATTYYIRAELREVGTNTFNDVNGIPPGNLYGNITNSSSMISSEDVGTTGEKTIHPDLEEFFEIETI